MIRVSEVRNRHLPTRKHRFVTDNSSKGESQSESNSSQNLYEASSGSRNPGEARLLIKLKCQTRRTRKFLTETDRSSDQSQQSEQSEQWELKRQGGDLQQARNDPIKKVKPNEEEVDLNKIMQEGLNFVEKMKNSIPKHLK